MQIHHNWRVISFTISLTITAGIFLVLSNQRYSASVEASGAQQRKMTEKRRVEKEEIPVVRFETQEPGKQSTMRRTAQDAPIEEMPDITNITESDSWIERLPALPIEKSDAVVIGTVMLAEAHLSTGRTSVYCEYTISVDEVLRDNRSLSLPPGRILTATREGGKVQFSSGHVQTYRMSGEGFLQPNRKYVLFVKHNEETKDFLVLTGYQLKKGRVIPVDQVTGHAVYEGTYEADFIDKVRKAIANAEKRTNR